MSDEHLLPRGATLGRYIVLKHLGTGGQGVVYDAIDPELNRRAALKLLRPDVGEGSADDRKTRMLREAQEHARLSHPNVVPILHVGTFLEQLYLAMPLMAGGTLKDWLASERRTPAAVLARFVEAGRGLAAAHAQGLVHRDFKPDNVMLDERGVAHVTDFGLAQRGSGAGGAGTARYMSPEQHARTRAVNAASDQFSFCVALCEALTGQLPYDGPESFSAGPKLAVVKALPTWLRAALLRGLAVEPGARFPSMDALLAALEEGPERRRRRLSQVGFTLLVGVFALAIGRLLTRESAEERTQRECLEGVQAEGEQVWSAGRVAQMGQSFSRVGGAVGRDTFARVKTLLDPEVSAWTAATGRACVQPTSTAHRRCLESRGRVLQSLSELFVDVQPDVLAAALSTVHLEVLPVAGCLTTSVATPRVVPDSEVDQRLRPTLARARVLRAAGQYPEAIVAAMAVVEQAHALGAVRVEAEAQLLAGQLYAELGRPDTEAVLLRGVLLAEQASADEERARGWMTLITWYAAHDELEASARARDQADSILERLGRPDHLEAQLQNQVAQLLKAQGDLAEAAVAFKRALELRRKHYADSHPLVSRALTNYALTLPPDEARPLLQSVLDTRAASFGEQHPETAVAAHNLGEVLLELDPREALTPLTRALHIWQGQTPPDQGRLAREHFALARAHDWLRELDLAAAEELEGIDLILRAGGALGPDTKLQDELEWLQRLFKRLARPEADQRRVAAVLEAVRKNETLPLSLGSEQGAMLQRP